MAELMANNSLQFIAIQYLQGAPRNRNRGVAGRVARREGVDATLLFEYVYLGHGYARCDRHLLDDIAQTLPQRVADVV